MFNVSIREYFSVLNVFIVCIRNTARSKSIPLLCTHVDSYKFSTVHPPSITQDVLNATTNLININDLLMEENEFSNVMRDVDPFQ
jgi:hypothetical protein